MYFVRAFAQTCTFLHPILEHTAPPPGVQSSIGCSRAWWRMMPADAQQAKRVLATAAAPADMETVAQPRQAAASMMLTGAQQ
eukprot:scaffold127164_cov12-Tisochrysis_lutea.AAC.1